MIKRRIEVTREHWKRIRVEGHGAGVCPLCRGVSVLASMPLDTKKAGVSAAQLSDAIQSDKVMVWETESGELMVCLGCVKNLGGFRTSSGG